HSLVLMDQVTNLEMTHHRLWFLSAIGRARRTGQLPATRDGSGGARTLPDGRAAGSHPLCRINDLRASRPGASAGLAAPPAQAARPASVVKLSPQPHSATALGLAKANSWVRPLRT